MSFPRSSGILVHPTCLPSPYGIGDLGTNAYRFVDFLVRAGQKLWQVLPLNPVGYGYSPYMCFSAIAGNHLLISPELLLEENLLSEADIADPPHFPEERVDFARVIPYKMGLLEQAFANFQGGEEFEQFCQAEAMWLEDYALFMALQEEFPELSWHQWPPELVKRKESAIAHYRGKLEQKIDFHYFLQFQFFRQWLKLKEYANERGIKIIGDIPIYVAHHSADVWANPENFMLAEDGSVAWMAGVPPDYFSATGQLWGNPVYNWEYLAETEFQWWVQRFRFLRQFVDIIRIDHFRGLESFWQVPAGETTAIKGEWQPALGRELLRKIQSELGELPILAEDLGVITPAVDALREEFQFPTMRVLLFAFGGGSDNTHLPHHYQRNTLVYTGTHDNDTAVGWWQRASRYEKQFFYRYCTGYGIGEPINWALVRMAFASVADLAIIPLQDILGLDNSARMNKPGTIEGNWEWCLPNLELALTHQLSECLQDLTQLYSR
ncbi:MAG: 4-alpha-glucanotransferase [Pseudanabaenaceae cyanobacterium]